jgi:hypothetical protein
LKGQLSQDADRRQAAVEDPLALLGSVLLRLEHDNLRVRQAMRRAGLADLLGPVVADHALIRAQIRLIQDELRALWDAGQASRWK